AQRLGRGHVAWIRFRVSDAACGRMRQYYDEYRARGLDRFYGLHLRPLYGEGAGCSAFGTSFLEVAGILDPELSASWSHVRDVPESLIGDGGKPKVGLLPLLFSSRAGRWAKPGEPARRIGFWDPDRMFAWIQATWKAETATPTGRFLPERRKKSKG